MRYPLPFALLTLLFACCQDPQMPNLPEPVLPACATQTCVTEEIHMKYFLNGECTVALYTLFDKSSLGLSIEGGLPRDGSIGEGFSCIIFPGMDLADTLWLGRTNFFNIEPGIALGSYFYVEEDTSVGTFKFEMDVIDPESYLIIDHFNADTTVLEGRFQCRFTDRSVNPFVGAPDTLRLECGSFKVSR